MAKMKEYQEEFEEEYDMCDGLKGIIEDSKNEGKIEGKNEERKVGMQYLVECCQEFGGSVETAISQLIAKYKLSQESAGDCVKQYWR